MSHIWYILYIDLTFCILSCSAFFFSVFSTPSQNVEFHINQSDMEIKLSRVIRFCTRKMIKRTHFMSLCKVINVIQVVVKNFYPKNVSSG